MERHRFKGRDEEPEVPYVHFRAREYDPHLGRFIQKDPALRNRVSEPYIFAKNNPVSLNDPLGLDIPEDVEAAYWKVMKEMKDKGLDEATAATELPSRMVEELGGSKKGWHYNVTVEERADGKYVVKSFDKPKGGGTKPGDIDIVKAKQGYVLKVDDVFDISSVEYHRPVTIGAQVTLRNKITQELDKTTKWKNAQTAGTEDAA